jgi:hypothetical protein
MLFLDEAIVEIPTYGPYDWNQWDMEDLVNGTNGKYPDRISSQIKAQLLYVQVELKLCEF